MKPSVYVETTVIGYLTSWPSDNLVVAGHQRATREWWEFASERFALMVSELVVHESGRGDPVAVKDRLEALRGLPVLGISDAADRLAKELVSKGAIPQTEPEDALHVATAVVNGVQYLVTWNFKHIANATMLGKIHRVCVDAGFSPLTICSPEALLES